MRRPRAAQIVPGLPTQREVWGEAALLLPTELRPSAQVPGRVAPSVRPEDVAAALELLYSVRDARAAWGEKARLWASRPELAVGKYRRAVGGADRGGTRFSLSDSAQGGGDQGVLQEARLGVGDGELAAAGLRVLRVLEAERDELGAGVGGGRGRGGWWAG